MRARAGLGCCGLLGLAQMRELVARLEAELDAAGRRVRRRPWICQEGEKDSDRVAEREDVVQQRRFCGSSLPLLLRPRATRRA